MNRFFVNSEDIEEENGTAVVKGDAVNHITRVLRLRAGDTVIIADGIGSSYLVEIAATDKEKVLLKILEKMDESREPFLKVILAQALAKGEKMDYIVQKCTELGVSEIIPFISERTVVKLNDKKAREKVSRWQKIARGAAQQSQRNKVPLIREVSTLKEVLEGKGKETLCIFLWEQEQEQGIKDVLGRAAAVKGNGTKEEEMEVMIIIGPEGGFSENEGEMASKFGVHSVLLGPRILRTETAALAALTIVSYELGDLGGKDE